MTSIDQCKHIFQRGKNKDQRCKSKVCGILYCYKHQDSDIHRREIFAEERRIRLEDEKRRHNIYMLRKEDDSKIQSESVHLPCKSFTYKIRFLVIKKNLSEYRDLVINKDHLTTKLKDFYFRDMDSDNYDYEHFHADKILNVTCDRHGEFCPHEIVLDEEDQEIPCIYTYNIRYLVVGTDHDGYCSNTEGDDIQEYRVKSVKKNYKTTNLKNFNFFENGCSSARNGRGSGYCDVKGQNYYATEILSMTCDSHGNYCNRGFDKDIHQNHNSD